MPFVHDSFSFLSQGAAIEDTAIKSPSAFTQRDFSGSVFGDFTLLRKLGEGGMGQVYLAEQVSLQRRVAVKLLKPEFSNQETLRKRFMVEAQAVARLQHPHIVQIFFVGSHEDKLFMAMEYVEGTNLKDYLEKKGPPETHIAITLMKQVTSALVKAAEVGIIHRDIKPENILITRKAEVKVADFGLSKMPGEDMDITASGIIMGTPRYMSPEQVMGKRHEIDSRSDLYSLGATFYHVFTGQPPFQSDTVMGMGVLHVSQTPVVPKTIRQEIPEAISNLILQLLEKKPEHRPQSAREVLRELKKISTGSEMDKTIGLADVELLNREFAVSTQIDRPSTIVRTSNTTGKRNWLIPAIIGSIVVAILGGGLIGKLLRDPVPTSTAASTGPKGTQPSSVSTSPDFSPAKDETTSKPKDVLPATLAKREEELLTIIKETANPEAKLGKELGKNATAAVFGIDARAELMEMYLFGSQGPYLNSARKFIAELILTNPRFNVGTFPYHQVGQIGQAGMLSLEDKVLASNQRLIEVFQLNNENLKGRMRALLGSPHVKSMVLTVLKRNQEKNPLPLELQNFIQTLENKNSK